MKNLDPSDTESRDWWRFSWKINVMHQQGALPQYLYDDFVNMGFFSRLPSHSNDGRLAAMQERLMGRVQQYETGWRDSLIKERILQIEMEINTKILNVDMVIPNIQDQEETG